MKRTKVKTILKLLSLVFLFILIMPVGNVKSKTVLTDVSQKNINLVKGDKIALNLTIYYQKNTVYKDETIKEITYKSSNKKVASVNKSGIVTAKNVGTSTVKCDIIFSNDDIYECIYNINIKRSKASSIVIKEKKINKDYKNKSGKLLLTSDRSYPIITANNESATKKINAVFTSLRENDLKYVKEIKEMSLEDSLNVNYSFITYYEIRSHINTFLSLTQLFRDYTGGAHGNYAYVSYNFDLNTGKQLQLSDLFNDVKDYLYINIKKQMKAMDDESFYDDFTLDNMIWYIEGDNLVILFNPYDIAPYVAGAPIFNISLKSLQDYMTDYAKEIFNI